MKTVKKYINKLLWVLPAIIIFNACRKEAILNDKPSTSLAIPTTIEDFQAMLDNSNNFGTSGMAEISSDNYYMKDAYYVKTTPFNRNLYTWKSDIFETSASVSDWDICYSSILSHNLVIEGIAKTSIPSSALTSWNAIKGGAYFLRGYTFFNLSQLFCGIYDQADAGTALGIPLRLSSDINATTTRSTIQQTYSQIVSDIMAAKDLLPERFDPNNKYRPSKTACYALLARVYLSMRDYDRAGKYADSCLQLYNTLINYNNVTISSAAYRPWTSLNNDEVIFNTNIPQTALATSQFFVDFTLTLGNMSIDTTLYNSYSSNDLRRSIFFYTSSSGTGTNGGYGGFYTPFSGLATDEMFLIRAECNARSGRIVEALNDLNLLLVKRYKPNTYTLITAANSTEALNKVLVERRKELPFRNVRWSDLRRLNKEGANITLNRVVQGQSFSLTPNDPKYILPIPPIVIQMAGIPQNPR